MDSTAVGAAEEERREEAEEGEEVAVDRDSAEPSDDDDEAELADLDGMSKEAIRTMTAALNKVRVFFKEEEPKLQPGERLPEVAIFVFPPKKKMPVMRATDRLRTSSDVKRVANKFVRFVDVTLDNPEEELDGVR